VVQKEYNDGFKLPGGTQVRLLVANTGNSKVYAKPVAQQIVQVAQTDKTIVGVMGWPYSSRTLNAIGTLAAAHIPMVSQTATSVVLSGISPYFFRVAPPDTSQAAAGARYVEQTLHDKAVALFEDPTDAYSKSLGEAFKRQFTADGNSIVVTEQYTVGKPETVPTRLQDALTHNPDLIYFSGFSSDVSALISNLPTTGQFANLLVMGGDGLYVLSGYSKEAHADFGRLRFTALAFPDEWDVLGLSAQKPAFYREYPEHFDPGGAAHPSPYGYSRPDSEVMLGFDATLALLEGCRIALIGGKKSISGDDLRHALTMITGSNAIQGVSGQIAFGPDGNPIDKAVVVLGVTSEGFIQIRAVQGRFLKG
jgi:ABC-type branched-subunit amino acid transport system substrate-binding protein